jgi:lipopolysaccharide export system permease protein
MRLLDRYLLRELIVPLLYCLVGFFVFWVLFDLVKELDSLQEAKLGPGEIALYYLVKSPAQVVAVLPVALLLGLLYTLSNHARHHELTAIRAAGVSLWRLSLPYFGVGLAAGVVLFVLNEFYVPDSLNRAAQIKQRHGSQTRPGAERGRLQNLGFTNARDRREWLIGVYDVETAAMENPQVIWTLADGSQRWLKAARARYTNPGWTFFDALEYRDDPRTKTAPVPSLQTNVLARPQFTETPDEIRSEIKIASRMAYSDSREADLPLSDIFDYLRFHPNAKRSDQWWLYTKLHGRLAAPWTCLVVVLIALPFGAASGRRNVFVGVASSIFIAFAFLALTRVSLALGASGYLPAWLAGWLPNLIFGSAGFWLTARAR